jgi:hypothetical protein
MGTSDSMPKLDCFVDQIWLVCSDCGCLQLKNLIPLEVLYKENHSLAVVGQTWNRHHLEFKKFIMKDEQTKICEIGASHGFLASSILDEDPEIDYLIIEPDPTITDIRIRVIKGFLEDNLDKISPACTILHSHVLEHVYKPLDFLFNLAKILDIGSYMFISFPNIPALLQQGGSNALNFEHTFFLTTFQLFDLIPLLGLQIVDTLEFEKHSHFVKLQKVSQPNPIGKTNLKLPNMTHMLGDFDYMWDSALDFAGDTNQLLKNSPKNTYIFGAHVFAQTLLCMGIEQENVLGILDNSPGKIGKRLYGTNLLVFHPSEIKDKRNVRVILRAAQYQDEIKEQLMLINPAVEIIE